MKAPYVAGALLGFVIAAMVVLLALAAAGRLSLGNG